MSTASIAMNPAAPQPAALPVAQAAPSNEVRWANVHNATVKWISQNSFNCVENFFSIQLDSTDGKPADGLLKKIGKIFSMAIAALLLFPIALTGSTLSALKNGVWGKAAALSSSDAKGKSNGEDASVKVEKKIEEVTKETVSVEATKK